jgi:hypothetical protein
MKNSRKEIITYLQCKKQPLITAEFQPDGSASRLPSLQPGFQRNYHDDTVPFLARTTPPAVHFSRCGGRFAVLGLLDPFFGSFAH